MNFISYVMLALILIPAVIVLISFIINNREQIKVESLCLLIIIMILGVIGLIHFNNISDISLSAKQYTLGRESGYKQGVEETKVTSQIYGTGYGFIDIEYKDGSVHRFEYEPEEEYSEEENYGAVKTYESYKLITNKTASQTKLNNLDCVYTDSNGMRRIYDYYLVAMGSYYGSIGDIYEITLSTGRIILVVKGDAKADKDTDSTNRFHSIDTSVIEFIVDQDIIESKLNGKGDCSYISGFEGSIINIKLVGHYNF